MPPKDKNNKPVHSKKIVQTVKKQSYSSNNKSFLSVDEEFSDSDHGYTESDEIEDNKVQKKIKPIVKKESDKHNKSTENNDNVIIEDSFIEKISKYIKIDNLIRKETVEYKQRVNTLKEDKQEMEAYILRYLDTKNEKVINMEGSGKLTKYESVRKSGLSKDIIKQSIIDQIKKEKLMTDDAKINDLAELTCELMESKRETKTKTVLKRTFVREKKGKKNEQKTEDDEKPKKNKKSEQKIEDEEKPKKNKKK